MADKLKRCPFCGGDDIDIIPADIIAGTQYWRIYCYGCGCTQTPISNKEEAIEKWNNRPSPWHTGTPTDEGWYLIAYKPIEQDSPLVYYTWHQWRDAEGYWQSDGIRPNDFWKPIAWQKIEED